MRDSSLERHHKQPVTSQRETASQTPQLVCPTCGTAWCMDDDGVWLGTHKARVKPLSQSGVYCAECIVRKLSTDKNLLAWFDADRLGRDILEAVLNATYIPKSAQAEEVAKMLRENCPQDFAEWMRDYSEDHDADFEEWLMEKF